MGRDLKSSKDIIILWIREKVKEAGASGAVVGLSGGVDSSLVVALARQALGENLLGVIMPCESNDEDARHAKEVAKKFRIKTEVVDLCSTYQALSRSLPEGGRIARANIKPRLRMATLYYFANSKNYVVLGTDNRVELMLGYFTKYGDGGVDLLPIADLYKGEVREMARTLGVPTAVLDKPPSAGLWSGQTDEGEIGMTYDEMDMILRAMDEGKTASIGAEKLEKIKKMIKNSEHKRVLPQICRL
jgi:NAD+ synthase